MAGDLILYKNKPCICVCHQDNHYFRGMMIQDLGVIFDMDGVLLDTEPLWGESMMNIARSHNINVTYADLRFTTGLRIHEVTDFWAHKFPWSGPATAHQVAEDILEDIIANACRNAKVMPGITHHLSYLKARNIPIGVATSSTRRMMETLLKHFGIDHFFDHTVCGDEVALAKPHPEIYLKCAQKIGVQPYNCVAVEDSVNGMVSAKAARMKVIIVPEAAKINLPAFGLADKKVPSMEWMDTDAWHSL